MNYAKQARAELINLGRVMNGCAIPGDVLRRFLEIRIGAPPSPNAWGGIFQSAIARGIARKHGTRKHFASRHPSARGRMVCWYWLPIRALLRGAT